MSSMRGDPSSTEGRGPFGDPALSTAPAQRERIHPSVWEGLRDRITQLYCVEHKRVVEIQSIMEVEHDFFPPLRHYKLWILKWGLHTKKRSSEDQFMAGRQVETARERVDFSSVNKTGPAEYETTESGLSYFKKRDFDSIARPPSLSRHHTYLNSEQADIYKKTKQPAADSKAGEEVRETSPASQTEPNTSKSAFIPVNDGSRSFNCPCCTNLYFYEDLFKCHLLQHLGDTPYVCVTCGDTFSRLDLLSQHYQECSVSRGNPGASQPSPIQTPLKWKLDAWNSFFVPNYGQEVDMQKFNTEAVKKWIKDRLNDLLGTRVYLDHPAVQECFNIIERNRFLDIASMQRVLHELLGVETATFCGKFWELCRSAQSNSQDIPKEWRELLETKDLELTQKNIAAKTTVEGAPQSVEPEEHFPDPGSLDIFDTQLQEETFRIDWLASIDSAFSGCNRADYEPANELEDCMEVDQYAEKASNDLTLSDCESTDTGSAWMSDYSSVHMLDEDHPFSLIKPLVIQEGLLAFQNAKQRARAESSTSATSGSPNTALGAKHIFTTQPKKRSRNNQDGSEEPGDSEDDEDLTAKRRRTSKRAVGNQPSFACPFAKKDPLKYRGCYAYVLKRVRDVKQHLSRFHQLPIYCPRCTDTFEAEDERDEHIRASSCLVQQDTITFEGVTRAQKTLLGQRVSGKMTPSDQWFTIFDILFPGHTPRPKSAYINTELTIELEAFQDLMYAEGPGLISSAITSSGLDISAIENVEDDSTALLQSAIQDGLQQVFQRWLENMPGSQHESADSRLTTLYGSSTSPACHGMQGSEPSRSSSNTLIEDLQEMSTTTEQGGSFHDFARYQDHALAQGISSSSEDMAADAPTLLSSNTDQQNSNPIRNADIQSVVHDENVIEEAAHLESLAADGWEALVMDTLESGDSWNFDAGCSI